MNRTAPSVKRVCVCVFPLGPAAHPLQRRPSAGVTERSPPLFSSDPFTFARSESVRLCKKEYPMGALWPRPSPSAGCQLLWRLLMRRRRSVARSYTLGLIKQINILRTHW